MKGSWKKWEGKRSQNIRYHCASRRLARSRKTGQRQYQSQKTKNIRFVRKVFKSSYIFHNPGATYFSKVDDSNGKFSYRFPSFSFHTTPPIYFSIYLPNFLSLSSSVSSTDPFSPRLSCPFFYLCFELPPRQFYLLKIFFLIRFPFPWAEPLRFPKLIFVWPFQLDSLPPFREENAFLSSKEQNTFKSEINNLLILQTRRRSGRKLGVGFKQFLFKFLFFFFSFLFLPSFLFSFPSSTPSLIFFSVPVAARFKI